MFGECHAHIFMNGYDYKKAVADHIQSPNEECIRKHLQAYQAAGVAFVRDGGDIYGSSKVAKAIAPGYGIDYRTPIFAIHKKGCYGSIVGHGFGDMREYHQLVLKGKKEGADFVKIMTTGIMDFDQFLVVTGEPLSKEEVKEMVHIAHEEGQAVMVHANGAAPVQWAVEAGADSIEHGNYIDRETISMLSDTETVWVPTTVTIANLLRDDRFPAYVIEKILEVAKENIAEAFAQKAYIGLGSDGGAYQVRHGQGILEEYQLFLDVVQDESLVQQVIGNSENIIKEKFRA